MGLTVCPALYRDEKDPDKFYCKYAGKAVDPGLMPCLANFTDCPIYKAGLAREEERRESLEITVEAEEGEERPEKKEETVIITPEEEVLRELEELEMRIVELDSLWRKYEDEANDLIEHWEDLRTESERILAGLTSSISACRAELDSIETKYKLGLLDDPSYSELRESLEERLNRYEDIASRISLSLERVERLLTPHLRRVLAARAKPEINKLKVGLMKLQQLYESGKISEETYNKLKRELEQKIERLERVLAETE